MEVAVETKIALSLKANARIDAARRKKKRQERELQAEKRNKLLMRLRREDQTWADKRTAVCFLMLREVVANRTVVGTTIEAMESAVNSYTRAVMAMKTISRLRKNAKVFVTMPLVFAIQLRFTVAAQRTLRDGTSTRTFRNVRNSSSADATETKTTSKINGRARMLVEKTAEHQKLKPVLLPPQGREL